MKIRDIYEFINTFAPYESQLSFDNSGVNVGMSREIHKIGVCLDITDDAVEYAAVHGIDLIISHHPVIFAPMKSVDEGDVVYKLIKRDIAAMSAHTNLDAAPGGVCETLCGVLGLKIVDNAYFDDAPGAPLARICEYDGDAAALAAMLKARLNAPDVRYADAGKIIKKVWVANGAGADIIENAALGGCDGVVTSDVKHHQWLLARHLGISLFDAGHYCTEAVICLPLVNMINNKFGALCEVIPQTAPYKAI